MHFLQFTYIQILVDLVVVVAERIPYTKAALLFLMFINGTFRMAVTSFFSIYFYLFFFPGRIFRSSAVAAFLMETFRHFGREKPTLL